MRRQENGRVTIFVVLLVLVLIAVVACGGAYLWYKSAIKPIQSNSELVEIEIAQGSGISKIAEQLENDGVIKSANAFKIYCKINSRTAMQAGKYSIDKNMSIEEIINKFEAGNIVDETVTITFPEGKNMRDVVSIIADKTNNTEEKIYEVLEDENYLNELIDKYWFITDDIEDEDIYYSLEGYLYPDTYIFENADVDVKVIFGKMLDKMETVLDKYKDEVESSKYSAHEILSLASVVELEARNEEDRAGVASVFINRLNKKMGLQSDVTTYYALKLNMDERDLTAKELETKNPYNTRSSSMAGKIPVGPICMVSESSIKAILEHDDTKNLFFVADKNGKVYFSETNAEHEKTIKELKEQGLWYTYDE